MPFKRSKFYTPKPFKERVLGFFQSLLFWRSRKKGIITTSRIGWSEIREVFSLKISMRNIGTLDLFPGSKKEKYLRQWSL